MILVDTSVWIDHLRGSDSRLIECLEAAEVTVNALVIGELACGRLGNRSAVIALLQDLPHAPEASHQETLVFIERNRLMGRGIGYVDVHLLAATALGGGLRLWTKDNRLRSVAEELGLAYEL